MRNKRIIQAYDSINPNPAEKQKMLDAILAEAKLEEAPRKQRQKKEPIVYTAKPRKESRRSFFGALAASLVMVVLAGFMLAYMVRQPQEITFTQPVETVSTGTPYDAVLNKYKKAIAEGWSKDQCEIEGITPRMEAGGDFTKLGYAFLDLDGDGREELLIAEESVPHYDNLWDLYTTLEDGTPIQLWVDERDGYQGYLYEGNVIGIEYSGKDRGEYIYHTIQNGQFSLKECLMYSSENWAYTTGGDQLTMISPKEAADITYGYEHKKLELTWLADIPDSLRDTEALEWYTPVLEKYRTALAEGWDGTMCSENGLSFYTPIQSEYESLYYAMYDLNEDGIKDLIISEYPYREDTDTSFIDIHMLENGEMKRITPQNIGMQFLCEGGYIKDFLHGPGSEYENYVGFLKLTAGILIHDCKVYQKDGQWFTEGYRGVGSTITREEADEIVAQYPPLKLDFVEIESSGETESQSGYEAFDYIIRKYVTAINEGWTEHLCEQNDISPQIFEGLAGYQPPGWCLLDIDNNGVEELIISDGVYLYDLYVMMPHDGSPGHVLCANGGETYQLCENGVIEKHGNYSDTSAWRYYTLRELDLVQQDMVFYEGAHNQYLYGTYDNDLQPIAKEKAGEIIGRDRTMELDLTPFVEAPAFWPDEAEYYEPVLNIYRQAIREKWNPDTCVENGISLMVGYYGDFVEELGYTNMDLDGDGIDELIITDGTNIYDLYTIIQDEEVGPLRIIDAMERIEYFLLEDGRIYCLGSGSASVSYYTFYQLERRELRLLEGYMMDYETSPDAPWYYYNGVERGAPCPTETAVAAIDPVVFAHIPFTSFE